MKNIRQLKQEVQQAINKYFKNDKDVLDYIYVDTGKAKNGNTYIEVRGELGYSSMTKLADHLDKIVQKYDKDAYFEQDQPGIMSAYFDSLPESLEERLDKHIQSIKEVSELNGPEIEQAISKYPFKSFANLVIALLKPTIKAGSGKFIAPNFNAIKPLLILDIRQTVKVMTEEGMNKEEAKDYLLNPAKYDDEVGNYADTSFAEAYNDLCNSNKSLTRIHHFLDDLVDYLNREIKKNYKALKGQI